MSNTGTRAPKHTTYTDRALVHSEQDGDCRIWNGYMMGQHPYVGQPMENGQRLSPVNLRRKLLEERGETPPEGTVTVVTTCGNERCVNPDHFAWETREQYRRRQRNVAPSARITLEQLGQAWERRKGGEAVTTIATDLGISRQGLYRQWQRWGYK
jgi:hypothetical protein